MVCVCRRERERARAQYVTHRAIFASLLDLRVCVLLKVLLHHPELSPEELLQRQLHHLRRLQLQERMRAKGNSGSGGGGKVGRSGVGDPYASQQHAGTGVSLPMPLAVAASSHSSSSHSSKSSKQAAAAPSFPLTLQQQAKKRKRMLEIYNMSDSEDEMVDFVEGSPFYVEGSVPRSDSAAIKYTFRL